ncbi:MULTISPECIES: lipopolysaccharide transport periplasmic protein LptA [Roseobacter]|uniref:lipopolysaccharide transport periplasmic protein LptA n=1 Tax=Roseobacter TaxID=2433 RepID=UPI001BB8DE9C|nr:MULTISPECIES: lipopolysaccharide transport periplasmic protein LptA [Roseobacter]GIT86370.1 protein-glutamate methyltransferase [Roseobacter sp. OBYS 0001]
MTFFKTFVFSLSLVFAATGLFAQGTQVAFGTIQENSGLPVEVTADSLAVDQNAGTALFTDNVIVIQGEMRLSADNVLVIYDTTAQAIDRIEATGNVVLISGQDAAESERADYNVDDGTIVMSGSVLVAQGPSAISADTMTVQISDGTAQMSGRVKTVLQTGDQ